MPRQAGKNLPYRGTSDAELSCRRLFAQKNRFALDAQANGVVGNFLVVILARISATDLGAL